MFKMLLLMATLVTGFYAYPHLSRISGRDDLAYERLATQKKILRSLNSRLSIDMLFVEQVSGFHITTWCDGVRHTPAFILSSINDGHVEDAFENLRITVARTEALKLALRDSRFTNTPAQLRFEKLMELSREDGLVSEEALGKILNPYMWALERVDKTQRAEDFKTELAYIAQHEKKSPPPSEMVLSASTP